MVITKSKDVNKRARAMSRQGSMAMTSQGTPKTKRRAKRK